MSRLQPEVVRRFGAVQLLVGVLFAVTGHAPAVSLLFGLGGALGVLVPTWRDLDATRSLSIEWWHLASGAHLFVWVAVLLVFLEMGIPSILWAIVVLGSTPILAVAFDLAVGGRYVFPDLAADSEAR